MNVADNKRVGRMDLRKHLWALVVFATAATVGWAQAEREQTPDGSTPQVAPVDSDPRADARTKDSSHATDPEQTDSASDIGQKQVDSSSNRRSFFLAGLHVIETAEASGGGNLGNSQQISSFTTALGSLHWLSVQRRSQTAIDYLGGAEVYSGSPSTPVQQLNATHRIRWRRAQLTLTDEFGDLPGGSFGSEWFGGAAAYNLGVAGINANPPGPPDLSGLFGSINYTGTGITNVSAVEFAETLTQRSSITAAGGYGLTDYSLTSAGGSLINNHGTAAQTTYNYQLNRRNQIGFLYGFQNLEFPTVGEGSVQTNLGELLYGHQMSRKMDFELGVGPEFAKLDNRVNRSLNQLNVSGFATLNYHLRRASVSSSCQRLVTNGSGLFAGANTDACQFSFTRPTRNWSTSLDAGYLRLSQIGRLPRAIPAPPYQYGFAGAAVQRQFGPYLGALVSYQFSDQGRGNSGCRLSRSCNWSGQIHSFSVGINLVAPPKRLQ